MFLLIPQLIGLLKRVYTYRLMFAVIIAESDDKNITAWRPHLGKDSDLEIYKVPPKEQIDAFTNEKYEVPEASTLSPNGSWGHTGQA